MAHPKGTRSKNKRQKNYFNEKEMLKTLQIFRETGDEEVFKKLDAGIRNVINGMINRQFSYNSYIKNNRSDAEAECVLEIFRSLERFDADRGRLFAYINRIAKNTLLKYQRTVRKIDDVERVYTDSVYASDTETIEEILDRITLNQTSIPAAATRKVMTINNSISIMYRYFSYLKSVTEYYLSNLKKLQLVIEAIKFDHTINFEFNFEKTSSFINDEIRYRIVIENVDGILQSVLQWLQSEYPEVIFTEPEYGNYTISPRAVGYVKNYVLKNIRSQKIFKNFKTIDLIEFINYISYQKEYGVGSEEFEEPAVVKE